MTKAKILIVFLFVMAVACAIVADEPDPVDCKPCKIKCSIVPWPKECFDCCWLSVLQESTKRDLKAIVDLNDEISKKLKGTKGQLTLSEATKLLGEKEIQNIQEKFLKMSEVQLLYLSKSPAEKKKFIEDVNVLNQDLQKPEVK